MNTLEFDEIGLAYRRGTNVLDGVGFSVAPGEVVGLLGRNGAGKTTLIRIAMGMLEPQNGEVRVFGQNPRRDPVAVKRRIGYVSENQDLPEGFSVEHVIDFHRRLFPTWDEAMAGNLLDRFALPRKVRIKTLSKGQARQVALLCAVSHRPELLVLDEPAGGLDPAARREFLETSIELLSEAGSSILFSSHHMPDVERLAQRVVMIHEGRVLLDDELDRLREEYCLALVPHREDGSGEKILGLNECLTVRRRSDALHAIFRTDPDRCHDLLAAHLGINDVHCTVVGLEEMFVEMVGRES